MLQMCLKPRVKSQIWITSPHLVRKENDNPSSGREYCTIQPFSDYDFTAVAWIEAVPALQARGKQFSQPLVSSSPSLQS